MQSRKNSLILRTSLKLDIKNVEKKLFKTQQNLTLLKAQTRVIGYIQFKL